MDGMIAWMDCRGGTEGKNQAPLGAGNDTWYDILYRLFYSWQKNDAWMLKNQQKGNMTFQKKVRLDFIKKIKEKYESPLIFNICGDIL